MIKSKVYIRLAMVFMIIACLVYIGLVALPYKFNDSECYNAVALYRLLFCWGATYLCFEVEKTNRNIIEVWLLKWILIYITGFQFVRFIFNLLVDGAITKYEIFVLVCGLVLTIFIAVKHWRREHKK